MKLVKRILDDINKRITEIWDSEKMETYRYTSHMRDYPETHHIERKEVWDGSEETKEDETKEATDKPWENFKGGCKGCMGCSGIGEKLR